MLRFRPCPVSFVCHSQMAAAPSALSPLPCTPSSRKSTVTISPLTCLPPFGLSSSPSPPSDVRRGRAALLLSPRALAFPAAVGVRPTFLPPHASTDGDFTPKSYLGRIFVMGMIVVALVTLPEQIAKIGCGPMHCRDIHCSGGASCRDAHPSLLLNPMPPQRRA